MAEERVVVLPLSPPRRLVPRARFRSQKTLADRQVWADAWGGVRALVAEGWIVDRVEVEFASLPLLSSQAEDWVRSMCDDVLRVEWTCCRPGKRGETRVYLTRDGDAPA